jgi:hypothetical protein
MKTFIAASGRISSLWPDCTLSGLLYQRRTPCWRKR